METAIIIILVSRFSLLKKATACLSYFNSLHRLWVASGQEKIKKNPQNSSSLETTVLGKVSIVSLRKGMVTNMITSLKKSSFRKKSTMKIYNS